MLETAALTASCVADSTVALLQLTINGAAFTNQKDA